MKSEHRHELETNELSASLAKWIEGIKPYSGQIITAIVLLSVAYVGFTLWGVQSAQHEQEAWDAFALATDTSDPDLDSLRKVASDEQYAGTAMQEWAYAGWADRQVLLAINEYLYDRESANKRLESCQGIYQELAAGAGDQQVQNRARFGLARVLEMQNKLDEAKQQYLTVRGPLQLQAEERAEQLGSEEVQTACNWLATAELPKRDLSGGGGAAGERPEFDVSLPETSPAQGDSINQKSLEELLGGFNNDEDNSNRYGEEDESPADDEAPATESE